MDIGHYWRQNFDLKVHSTNWTKTCISGVFRDGVQSSELLSVSGQTYGFVIIISYLYDETIADYKGNSFYG